MTEIDKQIKLLNYEESKVDLLCNNIVYENKETDTEVTIQWDEDDQDCLIFANTISEYADWYGHLQHYPIGLTCKEYELFNSKIREMRKL